MTKRVRQECARAARRGLEFLYRFARDERNFAAYGSDLLNCFYVFSTRAADEDLRKRSGRAGLKLARAWRRAHPQAPPRADAETLYDLLYGSDYAERLGACDPAFKEQLRGKVGKFAAEDYLWFDPAREPPPKDVPATCPCGCATNERGRKTCRRCRRRLATLSRYLVWYVALIRTYVAARYGFSLGASYADVLAWLPSMRPYPEDTSDPDYYDAAYAVTHVVYTLNDYDVYRLSSSLLPHEFAFLKRHLKDAVSADDPEMTGEFLETLSCFGLRATHPLVLAGTEYLLARQNADGSWGETDTDDVYLNYHVTLAAAAGLTRVAWRGEGLSFPELRPRLEA